MTSCPVCRGEIARKLYPSYAGACITSDMMVLPESRVDNRLCEGCGLIFNAAGTRGFTEDFYKNSYSLMLRAEQGAIQSFQGTAPASQAERTYQILREMIDVGEEGRILEAGAGKGDFLGYFVKDFPTWKVSAFEPSASHGILRQRLPDADVRLCDYKDYNAAPGNLNIVVALGVLEHVEDPLDMMRWAHRMLGDGGHFYLRVPNFANNPNDLFCVDHLSKLTIPTLSLLAEAAGFGVVAVKEVGVPVFMALRKDRAGGSGKIGSALSENWAIVEKNLAVAKSSIEAVLNAHREAKNVGERFAIFGLGSSGLFAPFFGEFPLTDITAYVDENRTMWGSAVHDRPVGGLDIIESMGIRHVALAISPVYFDQVKKKLEPYHVNVYAAG